jgi:hypothetical protein
VQLLSPAYAIFLLLGVLPVLIHLHGRRRAQIRKLPTLLLLKASNRRVAQRTKFRHILLLLLRMLLLMAIPLLLARPFAETDSDLPVQVSQTQRAVLIFDDSLSMMYQPAGDLKLGSTILFERGRKLATRIIDALPQGAEAALILGSRTAEAPVGQLTSDRTRLYSAISALRPSYRASDLPSAFKRATQILSTQRGGLRRIYVIGDTSAHSLDGSLQPPAETEVSLVDVRDGKSLPNCAVVDLRAEPATSMGPRAVRVMAELGNFGDEPRRELQVTLLVDGQAVAKGLVDLAAARAGHQALHSHLAADAQSDAESRADRGPGGTERGPASPGGAAVSRRAGSRQRAPPAGRCAGGAAGAGAGWRSAQPAP